MAEVIRMALTMEECVEGKKQIAEHRAYVKRVKDENLWINTIEGFVRTKVAGMITDTNMVDQLDEARIKNMRVFEAMWSAMCESVCKSITEFDEQYGLLEIEIARRERMEANEDQ